MSNDDEVLESVFDDETLSLEEVEKMRPKPSNEDGDLLESSEEG